MKDCPVGQMLVMINYIQEPQEVRIEVGKELGKGRDCRGRGYPVSTRLRHNYVALE